MSAAATLANAFAVALGGALGSLLRFWLVELAVRAFGGAFPWGTLFVNVTGSFLIGFFATLTSGGDLAPASITWRHFIMTGVLGGYTTFSAFSLQSLRLAEDSDWTAAAANVLGSVALCLLAVWLGHLAALTCRR